MKNIKPPQFLKNVKPPQFLKNAQPPQFLKNVQRPQFAKNVQRPQFLKNAQPPPFLQNLYRDLRDRRLLLPAAVLLVALIVVPVALSSSSATTAPPAPSPSTAAEGSQAGAITSPAVLTEELGVTDYQKRLEQLQSKNPFKRQYIDVAPDTGSDPSSSGLVPSDSPTATTGSSISTTTPSTTEPTIPDSPSPSASTPPSSTTTSEPPSPTLFVFEADLSIGPSGDLTRRKKVELGKFLPSKPKPMVAFAGATEDMKHALFLVSADVSSVTGDGRCVPGDDNCTLLQLKVGNEAKLAYAPELDRVYKLKLHAINLAPADAADPSTANKRGKREREKRESPMAFAAQG